MKGISHNGSGQRTGTLTEVERGGTVERKTFLLDGNLLEAEGLRDFIKQEALATGKSVGDIFWGWFSSGRLSETSIQIPLLEVSESLRLDIKYNNYGQVVYYQEFSADIKREVEEQRTTVELRYDRKGRLFKQISDTATRMSDGTQSLSKNTQTHRYDALTGLLLGGRNDRESAVFPPLFGPTRIRTGPWMCWCIFPPQQGTRAKCSAQRMGSST
ncbi:MAG: hypothetical protein IPN90_13315 [Elusimicrobia bacterium]|nr:hypothetical protein [Elusimicrobiota bacterium]